MLSSSRLFVSYSFYILPFLWPKMIEAAWILMCDYFVGASRSVSGAMRPCEYCRLQAAWAQTGGSGEKALSSSSSRCLVKELPADPLFLPGIELSVWKGKMWLRHTGETVIGISAHISVWTLAWVFPAQTAAPALVPIPHQGGGSPWLCPHGDRGKWALL